MKRRLFLLAFLLSLTVFPARAAGYVVALDATWPPFEFFNTNKELTGFTIDLVHAVAREGGFAVTLTATTWDGIFSRLNKKDFDIVASSITITDERKKLMDFSLPYLETFQHLLLPVSSEARDFDALKNKVLGAQTGTIGQKLINSRPGFIVKPYDDILGAIEDLAAGAIEGVVCDYPVALYYSNAGAFKDKLKPAPFDITKEKEYYGFAVRKGDKTLLDQINKGLAAVKKKGLDREIYAKWFGEGAVRH